MGTMARANQSRIVVMGALMCCGMAVSCAVGPGASGARSAPEERQPAARCRSGEPLEPRWQSELTQRWDRIAAVHDARQSQPTMSAALACTSLNGFVQNCPAWDPRAPAWQVETCAVALDEDLTTARARADAYLNGAGDTRDPMTWVLGVPESSIWLVQGAPGNVRTSLARLESLRPAAAEHVALLGEAHALVADAQAISDANVLLTATTSSCESLAQIESHPLHRNRYAAAILSRVVAARRQEALARLRKELDALLSKSYAWGTLPDPERVRADAQWARDLATAAACYDETSAEATMRAAEEFAARIEQAVLAEQTRRASDAEIEQASPAEDDTPTSRARSTNRAEERHDREPVWTDSDTVCCRICRRGKACGNSCIARDKVCHKGPGCACDE